MMKRVVCAVVVSSVAFGEPAPSSNALPSQLDRVMGLARVWEKIEFFHPYLAYKDIDWDAALVAAIPKVEAAQTTDDYRAAIASMIAVLHDPVTAVVPIKPAHAPVARSSGDWLSWPSQGVLEVDLGGWNPHDYGAARANAARIRTEAAKAKAIVVDVRGTPSAEYFVSEIEHAMPAYDTWPTQRVIKHDGFRSQYFSSSGSYSSSFFTPIDHAPWPGMSPGPSRAVFIVDADSDLPALAVALVASGRGAIVADAPLREDSSTATVDVDAGGGVTVHVRTGELTDGLPAAEIVADPAKREARAIAIAKSTAPLARSNARHHELPPMRVRDYNAYADSAYPSRELRMLAGIRIWAVLDELNPYRELVPDWDRALTDTLPSLEAAADAAAYLQALRVLGTRLHDGHVGVWRGGKFAKPRGEPAIRLRLVEGQLAIVSLLDRPEASRHGLVVGDVVETIDGKPAGAALATRREITSGGTNESRDQRAAEELLDGPAGSSVVLGVRGKGDVTLVRSEANAANATPPPGPHWKRLDDAIGYADLSTLTVPEVVPMLAQLGDTRAMILDMRGYPNGTAWTLAPLLNVRRSKLAAWFDRPQVTADEQNTTHFIQPLPETPAGAQVYRGKVIVLIDDRAVSQAEHTCLFLNEAAQPTFIGSPTHGSNGDVTGFYLPGDLRMVFTGEAVRFLDGTQLQQRGVQPQILIRPTLAGLRAGKDEVLDRAIAFAKTGR
jgi:C-terminal processing protease CtpA/Prc